MQNSRLETRSSFWGGLARLVEGPVAWLVTLVLIPILFATVLLLPPINLLDRLQALTYTRISPAGGMVVDPDGTVGQFPGGRCDRPRSWPLCSSVPALNLSKARPVGISMRPPPICLII
jgi:hypothetical protein